MLTEVICTRLGGIWGLVEFGHYSGIIEKNKKNKVRVLYLSLFISLITIYMHC